MEPRPRKIHPNPQTEANCLSKLLFWWTNEVFQVGYERHLENVDIYDVLPEDSSIKLSNDLGREWEKEAYRWKTGGKSSLSRALFRCYGLWIIVTGIIFLIEEGCRIAQALFLGLVVSYFEPDSSVTQFEVYMYGLGWSLSYVLVIAFDNLAFHKSFYLGLRMRVATTSLIYRKLLRLSQTSLHDLSTASIVNLISTDAHRFDQSCLGVNYIWIGPLESAVVIVLLWQHLKLGPYCLIGVAVIAILTPIQFALGRYLSKLRHQMSQLSDRRVRVMSEIVTGITTIKMNCWEKPFSTLINAIRRSEWMYLRAMSHCRSLNSAMYFTSGKFIMFSTFAAITFMGGTANPSIVFTSLALYEILRASVSLLMPWGIQHLVDALNAITRLQKFLLLEERSVLEAPTQLNILNIGRPPLPDSVTLQFENYTASWAKDNLALTIDNLNFTVQKGQMWAVIGPMGGGKSSMFMAILGEIPRLGGFIRTNGKFGYVPQQPWVFAGTIRDNIIFGKSLDRRKYNRVIQNCVLLQDLESFPQGDLSVIGEKGITLTNGQKAKICLARAVYQDADTYLIDDIFTSMDEKTSIQVFTKCFCGLLNSKTILFVTSDLNFIRAADQILILKVGKIEACGTYEDIKNIGINLREVLADFGHTLNWEKTAPPSMAKKIEESLGNEGFNSTLRKRLSLDNCSSEESLESIMLEYKEFNDTDHLLEEEKECNSVGCSTYWHYFKTGGGICAFVTFSLLCVFVQISYILCDWWLYIWVREEYSADYLQKTNAKLANQTLGNLTTPASIGMVSTNEWAPNVTFWVYLGIFIFFILVSFTRASVFSGMAVRASKHMHIRLFSAVMRAPISFFKRNSASRVLSRFIRDTGFIDDPLPATIYDCIQFFGLVIGTVVLMGVANFWLFLAILPLICIFIYARYYYMQTARDIRRIESAGRTPIYQHLANTLEGLWTIRAFQSEERFVRYFDTFQDRHTAASYMYLAINRWFALRLDLLSIILVVLLGFLSVVAKTYIESGVLGLAMAYALNLMGLFQYAVRQSAELESQMSSVDRVVRYSQVEPEGDMITMTRPPVNWPQYGIVTFEGASLLQGDDGRKILKNLWCCIRAEEKVGVVGSRQELSKQGLISAILRLVEPSGVVRIDGIDICELGLQDLREKISVVPKDPLLSGGSMRRNLDPLTKYPDAHLWKALSEVHMKEKVERLPGKMYADLSEFSSLFGLGERQLMCLARAMLRNSKIIIIEECASIIDKRTDALIKYVLKTKFQHCTIVMIAQRISTVIDYDRVMVLEEGRVKEFDPAHILLENKNSHFYKMGSTLPSEELAWLKKLAQEKYEDKPYQPPLQSIGGELGLPSNSTPRNFLPSFQTNRLSGVLSNFAGNRFSTNRF